MLRGNLKRICVENKMSLFPAVPMNLRLIRCFSLMTFKEQKILIEGEAEYCGDHQFSAFSSLGISNKGSGVVKISSSAPVLVSSKGELKVNKRLDFPDVLRGFAIVLMVIYHFIYDMRVFDVILVNKDLVILGSFPKFIVLLFFVTVGMSLGINKKPGFYPPGFSKLCLKLFLGSLIITIVTYFAFPKKWVYFGTLHSILAMKLVIAPMRKWKWIHLLSGLGIIIPNTFFNVKFPFLTLTTSRWIIFLFSLGLLLGFWEYFYPSSPFS